MPRSSAYTRVVSGQGGLLAGPARAALYVGSLLYGVGVRLRNERFDAGKSVVIPPIPVISVGNITVGGTGKTPIVIEIVRRLLRMGRKPAVVARGFGGANGTPNDEELLIRRHCPSVAYVANADRVTGVDTARMKYGSDVVVLDDAFQHRRIGRALDIVLIDATCPFGFGYLLPRGLLREPISGLRRAHVTVLTRCDQVAPDERNRIGRQIDEAAPEAVRLSAIHKRAGIEAITGVPLDISNEKRKCVLFAGVGNPQAFAFSAQCAGFEVVGERWWGDHHRYSIRDVIELRTLADRLGADMLLTTEKDAVKLVGLDSGALPKIGVLTVAIDFLDDGDTILNQLLERSLP